MNEYHTSHLGQGKSTANAAWLRALELTAPITHHPDRIFPTVMEEAAANFGDAPALLSDGECFTYRALAQRANQYARWALEQNVARGDVVCLLMPNRPEYMAVWLGLTKVGGIVALLNTNLSGSSLIHCINIVSPKHIVVAAEYASRLTALLPHSTLAPVIWVHGASDASYRRIDLEVDRYSGEALGKKEYRMPTIDDRALCIYTSGTTGLPKAANVSHGRIMQWSYWFSGMMGVRATDRLYDCLPLCHGVGGVQAPGALLVGGGSVVIRDRFSTSHFWNDVTRWECTLFQYIGELCRYLLNAEPIPDEIRHQIRMACGNGLRADIWEAFQSRFHIPHIFEFYGTSEGSASLFNVEGERGAIGRIPSYLAHRFPTTLIRYDFENDRPVKDEQGFCIACAPNEVGEAITPLQKSASSIANRFEGYTDAEASEKKVIRNVFKPGDTWFRTGDLMRRDKRGFFYFVDRVGDTYRWKGENIATSEVAKVICAFPGVKQANVYGVAIPGTDGRVGMAALSLDGELRLSDFRVHLMNQLPGYASPLFLRIQNEMDLTGTFRYRKADLVRQGYDPTTTTDVIYFNHPDHKAFVRLDELLYNRIQTGLIRL